MIDVNIPITDNISKHTFFQIETEDGHLQLGDGTQLLFKNEDNAKTVMGELEQKGLLPTDDVAKITKGIIYCDTKMIYEDNKKAFRKAIGLLTYESV